MNYVLGSLPILFYPLGADEVPTPPTGFLLLTDFTNVLMSNNTPLETAGA